MNIQLCIHLCFSSRSVIGLWWRIVLRCGVQILAGRLFLSCSELSVPVTRGEDSGLLSEHPVTLYKNLIEKLLMMKHQYCYVQAIYRTANLND